MSDLRTSFIRTLTPLVAGYLVSFSTRHGLGINDDNAAVLVMGGGAYGYYVLARLLETQWGGRFGWLLGSPRQPSYVADDPLEVARFRPQTGQPSGVSTSERRARPRRR